MARFGKLFLIALAAFAGMLIFIGIKNKFDDSDIPIGCEQFFQAQEACIKAWRSNLERTNASETANADKLLNNLEGLRADVRQKLKVQGEQATAEYCTSKEFVDKQGGNVANLATILAMTGGMDEDCQSKYSQIHISH